MSNIDLSKAKIGDKFRTRGGGVVEYVKYENLLDLYIVSSEYGNQYPVQKDGRYLRERECFSDLIVQVLDKPLDELIEEGTKQFRESRDAIAEENELQRREEVVELAERLLFMNRMHDAYEAYIEALNKENLHTLISFPLYILQCAEDFIKYKNQYLKEGKL
jgi:rubrerythrin